MTRSDDARLASAYHGNCRAFKWANRKTSVLGCFIDKSR